MEKVVSNIKLALIASLTIGLAPFVPAPHIIGKVKWVLGGGKGMEMMDIFDFLMHGLPWFFLIVFTLQYLILKFKNPGEKIDFQDLIKIQKAKIIDVREPSEFAQGHFKGAENIPLSMISKKAEILKRLNKPIVLYCRSGNRSGQAVAILKAAKIEKVYNGGGLHKMKKFE